MWGRDQQGAFQKLKDALCSAEVLAYPDYSKPFQLHTDASGTGLGAVLAQNGVGGVRPVVFASRLLSPAERNYTVTEREVLAVVWSIRKFRSYLEGGLPFEVYTDHQAMTWLMSLSDPTGRLARWGMFLSMFDMEIKYRPGVSNADADGLSRICAVRTKSVTSENGEKSLPNGISEKTFLESQKSDKEVENIVKMLSGGSLGDKLATQHFHVADSGV
eukprot:Rmarinus@m.27500